MSVHYSIHEFVQTKFQVPIAKWGLRVDPQQGDITTLRNQNCVIFLENGERGYIDFRFSEPRENAERFLLSHYLESEREGLGQQLVPIPDSNLSDEERIDHYMDCYLEVLQHHFNRPLMGDFSWKDHLHALRMENDQLLSLLTNYRSAKVPGADAIGKMRFVGDLRWKDELRKLRDSLE